jgi:succinoglycan biosynthesis transport protein ExoP
MVTTSAFPPSKEEEFGYGQLFLVLLRRWPWILGALGLSLAGAVYVNLQQEPIYESSMQLLIEPNYETDIPLTIFSESLQASGTGSDYATQLTLMRSEQFFTTAAEKLQTVYPEITSGEIQRTFLIDQVLSDDEKGTTSVFEATFISNDPIKALRVLETLQETYIDYNLERQEERLRRGLSHVDEQLEDVEKNLRNSQSSLEQFRQEQSLIDPTLQGQFLVDSLNRVQEEQQRLASELTALESSYSALGDQLRLSPQAGLVASRLTQSSRVQGLLNTMQTTALSLAERQILFTDQDPVVKQLQAQQQNQMDLLRQEIGYILRRPVDELNPEMLSFIQLGTVDVSLVSQLIETDAALAALEARAESLIATEGALLSDLERFPSLIAEYDRLQPAVEIERATLQRLLGQREQLTSELARDGFNWEVVEPPVMGKQIGPNPQRNLLIGAVLGLFLGGLLAFARETTDNVLHTSDDLKRQVSLPLLGILPLQTAGGLFSFGASRREGSLTPILHPELAESELIQTISSPAFREAMDVMTNSLQLRSTDKSHKAFAITSGLPGEGKTTVALGLALSLARMNQRVLLIDADLRRSGLQAQLGIASEHGLSTFLRGLPIASRPHRLDLGYAHLDVLPAGPGPEDPLPLLSSPRFNRLLAKSREIYDVILIDTPPVLGMADAVTVGAACDGTVVVSRLDRITQPELTEMLSLLAPLRVMGIIANGAKVSPNRYIYETASIEPKEVSARS